MDGVQTRRLQDGVEWRHAILAGALMLLLGGVRVDASTPTFTTGTQGTAPPTPTVGTPATPLVTETSTPDASGSASATPTVEPACPVDFEDDNRDPESTLCLFAGRINETCGPLALDASFVGDGGNRATALHASRNVSRGNAGTKTQADAAGCVGDCDGNGAVTINELVLAVDIALGGASLDACLAADASGDGSLLVNELVLGVVNGLNGCPTLQPLLIASLFTDPPIFFGAEVKGPDKGDLVGWFTQEDLSDLVPIEGSVRLADDGRRLLIEPTESPFDVDGCDFLRYDGTFTGTVPTPVVEPSAAR